MNDFFKFGICKSFPIILVLKDNTQLICIRAQGLQQMQSTCHSVASLPYVAVQISLSFITNFSGMSSFPNVWVLKRSAAWVPVWVCFSSRTLTASPGTACASGSSLVLNLCSLVALVKMREHVSLYLWGFFFFEWQQSNVYCVQIDKNFLSLSVLSYIPCSLPRL